MKTAKQFLDSILRPNAEGLYDGVGPGDLREYARQACEEQRRLCASHVEIVWDALGETCAVNRKSILNAPSPI